MNSQFSNMYDLAASPAFIRQSGPKDYLAEDMKA